MQILMKLHIKMSASDFFSIMHFGSSKNESKILPSKKSNECFTTQIPIKVHTKKSSNYPLFTIRFS